VNSIRVKPQDLAVIVRPRAENTLEVATAMLRISLADPQAAAHLQEMFWFWPEQEPISFERAFSGLDFLVSVLYLKSLDWLCRRHLRRSFQKEVSNLRGRVKGKILIGQNVRSNFPLSKLDHVWCSYQTHSMDTPPNRVLRTALEQARRCLHRAGITDLSVVLNWLAACHATLDPVPLTRIELNDVSRIAPRAAIDRPYKEPLRLARMVLALLGSDPTTDRLGEAPKVPPFAIDMNELFERYCEARMRRRYPQLEAFYRDRNLGTKLMVRPDFIIPAQAGACGVVVDAKYKYQWNQKEDRQDVYQLLAYSRHGGVLSRLHEQPERQIRLLVLYPSETDTAANNAALNLDDATREFPEDLSNVEFYTKQVALPR